MCHFLCFLFFITIHFKIEAANVVNYMPIGALADSTEANAARIELPQGFHPQAPPIKPMLLPFVTPAPSRAFSGWKPIVGAAIEQKIAMSTPKSVPLPPTSLTQDPFDAVSREQSIDQLEGPLESIVYGSWKPERPVSPEEMHMPTTRHIAGMTAVYSRKQPTTSLENLGIVHSITNVQATDTKLKQESRRKRITTMLPYHAKHLNFQNSDPHLPEMVGQINDPLNEGTKQTHIFNKQTRHQHTTEIPIETENETVLEMKAKTETETETEKETETETETVPIDVTMAWPVDFIVSLEHDNNPNLTQKTSSLSFIGDDSDSLQALNVLNMSSSLLQQVSPFSITKVGVPYENQNTAEEPTICVPLTVLEKLNQTEIAEVERVYCFPLPHEATAKMKDVSAKVENYTGYESVNATQRISLDYIMALSLCLNLLNFLKLKYS